MAHFGGFAPLPIRLGGTPTEGWTAAQHARFAADWCAIQRTLPFALLTFVKAGAVVTVEQYTAMHGTGTAEAPTPTVAGTGEVIWDWARNYSDAFGVESPTRIRQAKAWRSATTAGGATAIRESAVRVRTRSYTTGTGLDDARVTLVVW